MFLNHFNHYIEKILIFEYKQVLETSILFYQVIMKRNIPVISNQFDLLNSLWINGQSLFLIMHHISASIHKKKCELYSLSVEGRCHGVKRNVDLTRMSDKVSTPIFPLTKRNIYIFFQLGNHSMRKPLSEESLIRSLWL